MTDGHKRDSAHPSGASLEIDPRPRDRVPAAQNEKHRGLSERRLNGVEPHLTSLDTFAVRRDKDIQEIEEVTLKRVLEPRRCRGFLCDVTDENFLSHGEPFGVLRPNATTAGVRGRRARLSSAKAWTAAHSLQPIVRRQPWTTGGGAARQLGCEISQDVDIFQPFHDELRPFRGDRSRRRAYPERVTAPGIEAFVDRNAHVI
jgi:hypothetical protein